MRRIAGRRSGDAQGAGAGHGAVKAPQARTGHAAWSVTLTGMSVDAILDRKSVV